MAVHPNIPAPNDSQWAILRRRLAIMGYILMVPEMVILWAARQYFSAKYFAKQHQSRGWTMTHAFFVIMGGFTLHDEQGTPLRILEPNELESLSKAGRIQWPSITEPEIQDRSKGDHLSKAIVLIQTSWFITQCIVRGAYRLEVTEMEVTTLAFAVLTGVIYYLWWNKPLDVRCSVPVYLLKDDEKEKAGFENMSSVSPVAHPAVIPTTTSCDLNLENRVDSQLSPITQEIGMSDLEPNSQKPSQSPSNEFTAPPEFQYTRIQRFSSFIQRQRQRHGTVLGLAYAFVLYPVLSFFRAFNAMLISDRLDDSMPLRVPTFYSPTFTDNHPGFWESVAVAVCVAVVFGGIHCAAWAFHFPTLQMKLAWRISASSVAGLPIFISALGMLTGIDTLSENWQNIVGTVSGAMTMALFILYVIARIVLLVLPCIALPAPNPAALVEIQWAAFFPHIG